MLLFCLCIGGTKLESETNSFLNEDNCLTYQNRNDLEPGGLKCHLQKHIQSYMKTHFGEDKRNRKVQTFPLRMMALQSHEIDHSIFRPVDETSFESQLSQAIKNTATSFNSTNTVNSLSEAQALLESVMKNDQLQQRTIRDETLTSLPEITEWLINLQFAVKSISDNVFVFFKDWTNFLQMHISVSPRLSSIDDQLMLPIETSLEAMSITDGFMQLFWPFRHDVSKMNQKLALYGLTNTINTKKTKSSFFQSITSKQKIELPCAEQKIIYSFDHPKLVEAMNRTELASFSKSFVEERKHIFTKDEQRDISETTDKALTLINTTAPFLYRSIVQLVSTFAFYKTEDKTYQGGSISSLLGVIWLDPSAGNKWNIQTYAEMIVHEFIHTHLFYAEMVHGTYSDPGLISKAKVVSAIRKQPRDYDKSFHAAYVATGLATFHSRTGYLERARELTTTLRQSVDSLIDVNKKTGVLDESGNAMLQFLDDFLKVAKFN